NIALFFEEAKHHPQADRGQKEKIQQSQLGLIRKCRTPELGHPEHEVVELLESRQHQRDSEKTRSDRSRRGPGAEYLPTRDQEHSSRQKRSHRNPPEEAPVRGARGERGGPDGDES